jgi:hypothetical protein
VKRLQVTNALLEQISSSPLSKNPKARWSSALHILLQSASNPVRVLQLGTSPETSDLLRSQPVELVQVDSAATVSDQEAAQLEAQPGFDLALITDSAQAADQALFVRRFVNDGGVILWTGTTSWAEPVWSSASRTFHDISESFAEHFYFDSHQCLLLVNNQNQGSAVGNSALHKRRAFLSHIFEVLDQADIQFLLLGNPGNLPAIYGSKPPIRELVECGSVDAVKVQPEAVPDIDILTAIEQFQTAGACLLGCDMAPESDTPFPRALYSNGQVQFYFNREHVVRIHLFGGLQYSSLDGQNRVGLNPAVQRAVLQRRRRVPDLWRYASSINDSLVHNLCRCVFDKRAVSEEYARVIQDLHAAADHTTLPADLETVFFKFAGQIAPLIASGQTNKLSEAYLAFQDY